WNVCLKACIALAVMLLRRRSGCRNLRPADFVVSSTHDAGKSCCGVRSEVNDDAHSRSGRSRQFNIEEARRNIAALKRNYTDALHFTSYTSRKAVVPAILSGEHDIALA